MKSYSEELEILAKKIWDLMKKGKRFDTTFRVEFLDSELTAYDWHTVRSGVKRFHFSWAVAEEAEQKRQQRAQLVGARTAALQAKEQIAPLH